VYGIDLLIAAADCVLPIEGVFELIVHSHIVEVERVGVGCAYEVVVGPVQQTSVVVVRPARYLELPNRFGRTVGLQVGRLPLLLPLPLLQGVLTDPLAFKQRFLQFRVVGGARFLGGGRRRGTDGKLLTI
jgi:hypothetical protein